MLNNLRDSLKPVLQKIGKSFAATGLSPNVFTGIGLALAFVSSIIYGIGFEFSLILGGIALLASGFFDIVELNPMFDNGSTSSLAARLISIIISMNLK